MENNDSKFIGSGLTFPLVINSQGRPELIKTTELINASISHILSWPVRNKFFNENFGSRLEELLEEPDDIILKALMRHFVIDALHKWEKRIIINQVVLESKGTGVINIIINYNIRNTKTEETFIYPFYREIIY